MFSTYQCLSCKKHHFPPRAVCPFCYGQSLRAQPDASGTISNYTIDQRTQRILSVVQTKNNVLVMSESLHLIPIGQTAYLMQIDNKIISSGTLETTDEENT